MPAADAVLACAGSDLQHGFSEACFRLVAGLSPRVSAADNASFLLHSTMAASAIVMMLVSLFVGLPILCYSYRKRLSQLWPFIVLGIAIVGGVWQLIRTIP